MYLGSVRFYKHVIYTFMAFIFISLIIGIFSLASHLYSIVWARTDESLQEVISYSNIDDLLFKYRYKMDWRQIPTKPTPEFSPPLIGYQLLYPDMYSSLPSEFTSKKKVAYLTFDDGPSDQTDAILDILDEHEVKATFFVITSQGRDEVLARIISEGHVIGIHSHTHKYREIYQSIEAFLDDFNQAYKHIFEKTSVKPQIFRFPGGSINAYNFSIHQELIAEMLRRGFVYYDWNVSTEDTKTNLTTDEIVSAIQKTVNGQDRIIILAHDTSQYKDKLDAITKIIEYLKMQGYTFETLDNTVEPIVFAYPLS